MYKSFKDMTIWSNAIDVSVKVFELTEKLPKKEDYSLTSQIRRSALSISANIAEAFGRNHINDKLNFYYYSRGSITETQSHLIYGERVNYFTKEEVKVLDLKLNEIHNSINKIIKSLRSITKP